MRAKNSNVGDSDYNQKRPHSSLDDRTPEEFAREVDVGPSPSPS